MTQSSLYKHTEDIDYVGNFPGAVPEQDILEIQVGDDTGVTLPVSISDAIEIASGQQVALSEAVDIAAGQSVALSSPVEIKTGEEVDIRQDDSIAHPDKKTVQHDLADSDLSIGPVDVMGSQALIVSAKGEASWSASVQWVDDAGYTFQTESKADIGLSSVTDDWARLVRKGPQATVTFTDESGNSENLLNAYADTHR